MTRAEYEQKYGSKPVIEGQTDKPGYFQRVADQYNQAGNSVISDFQKMNSGQQESPVTALHTVGNIAKATFAPISEALSPVIEKGVDKISNIPAVQQSATDGLGSGVLQIADTVKKFGEQHPELARSAEDLYNIANVLSGAKGENVIKNKVESGLPFESTGAKGSLMTKAKETIRTTREEAPAKIMQRVARISKDKQAKFEKTAGESVGQYLSNRGIYGNVDSISEQLFKRFTNSKNEADMALGKLPGTYEPAPVTTALQELLQRELRVSSEGAPSPDLARVIELSKKSGKEGFTMSEINEIKRIYERNNKVDYLKQNLPESVARATNLDSAIREWQFKQAEHLGLKNLPEINKETRLAKQLLDDLGREYAGSAGNNAISLTDYILLAGGDPTAITMFITKKGLSNKSVQAALAKALGKNRPVKGEIKANMGESQVKRLMPPKIGGPSKQVNVPIKLPTRKQLNQGTEIVPNKK